MTDWCDLSCGLIDKLGELTRDDDRALDGISFTELLVRLGSGNGSVNVTGINESRNSRRLFRILMSMLGYSVGKDVNRFLTTDEIRKCRSVIRPFAAYMSNRFIRRFAAMMPFIDREGGRIRELLNSGVYAEILMKCVSSDQDQRGGGEPPETDGRTIKQKVDAVNEQKDRQANMISALKVENQRLRRQVEKSSASGGADQLLAERIEESIKTVLPSLNFVSENWTGDSSFQKDEKGTAVLHISDWHIGAHENVDGFNEFNYEIACERVRTLANKYIGWTKMHRAMYQIDELVIIATGDMISGDIHEELLRTNEFSVPEQCVKAATLVAKLASSLAPLFSRVRVEYIVADNHSRTTKKIQFGDGKNSYNYIVGYIAKLLLAGTGNVEFNLYPEIQKVIRVEGLRYLITHGNCVRGGFAGIPFYSMQRKVGAEAAVRMNMGESYHFDKIVMGHYHVPLRSTQYEMTGCLSSTTAFDQSAGRHCRACQTGWIVSGDNEIDYYELWLS